MINAHKIHGGRQVAGGKTGTSRTRQDTTRRAEGTASRAKAPRAPREHAQGRGTVPRRARGGAGEPGRATVGKGGPAGPAAPRRASRSGPPRQDGTGVLGLGGGAHRGGEATKGRGNEA
jgi:hypothetical protein